MEEREVKPFTLWKHFKGTRALVITVANHSETGEPLVVYRCMDNNGKTNHKNEVDQAVYTAYNILGYSV